MSDGEDDWSEGDDEDGDEELDSEERDALMELLQQNPQLAQQLAGLVEQAPAPAAVPKVPVPAAASPVKLIERAELCGEQPVPEQEPRAFLVAAMRRLCGGAWPAQFLQVCTVGWGRALAHARAHRAWARREKSPLATCSGTRGAGCTTARTARLRDVVCVRVAPHGSAQVDPMCALCVDCFQEEKHQGHDYSLARAGGGCCDCGDPSAW